MAKFTLSQIRLNPSKVLFSIHTHSLKHPFFTQSLLNESFPFPQTLSQYRRNEPFYSFPLLDAPNFLPIFSPNLCLVSHTPQTLPQNWRNNRFLFIPTGETLPELSSNMPPMLPQQLCNRLNSNLLSNLLSQTSYHTNSILFRTTEYAIQPLT